MEFKNVEDPKETTTPAEMEEEKMQHLRSKAAELLLREEWKSSSQAYSQLISLYQHQISGTHQNPDLRKSLCLAFSNRAEALFRLRDFTPALTDCDQALQIESTHFKTLLLKGKILLNLNRYSSALDCFRIAILDPLAGENSDTLNGCFEKCKKLESLSRTGAFDISDWVLNGFPGKSPELAEYIGPVEIRKSEISGRGLFATKNIDVGTLCLVTKAIATERGILPISNNDDSVEKAQFVMWRNFIDKIVELATKCSRTSDLIFKLSIGKDEDELDVPDIALFRPETEWETSSSEQSIDMGRLLSILDVNSSVEDSISAKVLGKNRDYYGIGLWFLACFINHSCNPNARRLHIGDHLVVHASRDVKAGEEITFSYFDVLKPLRNRREMAKNWGFNCACRRCNFEEGVFSKQEMREIEVGFEGGGDVGGVVYRLEEGMRRWLVRGKGKGYLRASFWAAYSEVFGSEKVMRRWGRRIPAVEAVVESVGDAVGSDERIINALTLGAVKRSHGGVGGGGGVVEMERAVKLGRGLYGKVMKKHALRSLMDFGIN